MQQSSISIRVDSDLKHRFYSLCEDLGLSAATAINIFMKTMVRERKVPFEISAVSSRDLQIDVYKANLHDIRNKLADSGLEDMSLEEINSLIAETRNERKGC